MAYLTVRIKDVAGHYQEQLEGGDRLSVGRSSAAAITIRHESISREHCAFINKDGAWYVEDLGSANGTMINKTRIEEQTLLNERDIIKVGKARLTFHIAAPAKRSGNQQEGIALDEEDEGAAPTRTMQANDPPQAMPCRHCHGWYSIAHRLPGDHITCPHCQKQNTVPLLVTVVHDSAGAPA